jgi:hypothetical protein
VHGIRITADGQVVVSDRGNNRIQVFQKDGTFVREIPVLRDSTGPGVTAPKRRCVARRPNSRTLRA